MNYRDLVKLTGAANKWRALDSAMARLRGRKWHYHGREYTVSGVTDYKVDGRLVILITFFNCESLDSGGVVIDYPRYHIDDAMDCLTGNLENLERVYAR